MYVSLLEVDLLVNFKQLFAGRNTKFSVDIFVMKFQGVLLNIKNRHDVFRCIFRNIQIINV